LISTEVGFAAEVRLGDSDLGLEAANALCGVMSGDLAGYGEAKGRVSSIEVGTRQHSLGVMALSCAYPELSRPFLLELVGSDGSGDAVVISILELARNISHRGGSYLEISAQVDSALRWATPQQAAVLHVAEQIVGGP
jgi:hypothetical protein